MSALYQVSIPTVITITTLDADTCSWTQTDQHQRHSDPGHDQGHGKECLNTFKKFQDQQTNNSEADFIA